VKNSVAIVGATIIGLVVFIATLTQARREYAEELLSNVEATALWKESDSIGGITINSHIIELMSNGDNASALQSLCRLLHQDMMSLEDLAELSELDSNRASALSKGHAAYNKWCVEPHA